METQISLPVHKVNILNRVNPLYILKHVVIQSPTGYLLACVKFNFVLEPAIKAQRGIVVSLYPFFNLGSGWGRLLTPRHLFFTQGQETLHLL